MMSVDVVSAFAVFKGFILLKLLHELDSVAHMMHLSQDTLC